MTLDSTEPLGALFIARSRYYLGVEYPAKIRRALDVIPEDAIWLRPAEGTNAAGNLVLHLAGNLQQWIVSGIGGQPDTRERDAEFATRGGVGREALEARLNGVLAEVDRALADLAPTSLADPRTIQGRETTVLAALYHAVEHASGHVGQLIYIAKSHHPEAIRFYEDAGGLARPTFLSPHTSDMG
jgi:uncharacterized damage-inducible protein DinB